MKKKPGVLVRSAFALPVLTCTMAGEAAVSQDATNEQDSAPIELSESVLDDVIAGEGTVTTLAIGEEGGGWTSPIGGGVGSGFPGERPPAISLPILPGFGDGGPQKPPQDPFENLFDQLPNDHPAFSLPDFPSVTLPGLHQ